MIILIATLQAGKGKEKELQTHLEKMVGLVKKSEPNCLQYTLHQGLEDKTIFFFYESYTDMKAIEFHRNTLHYEELVKNVERLLAGPVQLTLLSEIK